VHLLAQRGSRPKDRGSKASPWQRALQSDTSRLYERPKGNRVLFSSCRSAAILIGWQISSGFRRWKSRNIKQQQPQQVPPWQTNPEALRIPQPPANHPRPLVQPVTRDAALARPAHSHRDTKPTTQSSGSVALKWRAQSMISPSSNTAIRQPNRPRRNSCRRWQHGTFYEPSSRIPLTA